MKFNISNAERGPWVGSENAYALLICVLSGFNDCKIENHDLPYKKILS